MPKTDKNFDEDAWGVSFSIKQCRNFEQDYEDVLKWMLKMGFRRFRLMSYWDEHEKVQGELDFTLLDKQIELIGKASGKVTLCLGVRQPRWPENHLPAWALEIQREERNEALYTYIEAVVQRYKDNPVVENYQLENEALLKDFGENIDVDRRRLRKEFALVKSLDLAREIIMTTSTSWGVPIIGPIPDVVGFSFYQVLFSSKKQKYTTSFHKPWLDRLRAGLIYLLFRKPSFIHELQLEPWGPQAIWEMDTNEQHKSMGVAQIAKNIKLAKSTELYPIYCWGAEWWYWRLHDQNDPSIWLVVKEAITKDNTNKKLLRHSEK